VAIASWAAPKPLSFPNNDDDDDVKGKSKEDRPNNII
jgi:hypothetical protein